MTTAVITRDSDFEAMVLSCNKDGMEHLRKGQQKAAFEQFKFAETMLMAHQGESSSTNLLSVTCNNLGCYYKKVGKFHGALSYLRRALKMEVELNTDEVTLAGTHLNICAILSKLEKHDKALQHGLAALELVNKHISNSDPDNISQDDYSVLALIYHSVAVERDLLGQLDEAAASFRQGHQVARKCLGENHPLSTSLGKNCDAMLLKSQKLTKAAMTFSGSRLSPRVIVTQREERDHSPLLPSISGVRPNVNQQTNIENTDPLSCSSTDPLLRQRNNVRQSAADWIATEESSWAAFANSALSDTPFSQFPQRQSATAPSPEKKHSTMMSLNQRTLQRMQPTLSETCVPDFVPSSLRGGGDAVNYQDTRFSTLLKKTQKTPLAKALDDHPEALMDIIDADRTGNRLNLSRTTANDFRPNRVVKGSTRTSRVVRRTGMFNSTKHRDLVTSKQKGSAAGNVQSLHVQKCAAERIQRVWRAWHRYCKENADWMTTTWICATIIQARWRSYHVRRVKLDRTANIIQQHVRGFLVRRTLKKHAAAVTIQRHVFGILTRKVLFHLHQAALVMQALVRGGIARKRVRLKRFHETRHAIMIQCAIRRYMARCRRQDLQMMRDEGAALMKAIATIQRYVRGWKGRHWYAICRLLHEQTILEHRAATKLQAMVRRYRAITRADVLRAQYLRRLCTASIFVQRMWRGSRARRQYLALLWEFKRHESHIVTLQRYARGFLIRSRLWREAVRAEEELWAVVEIQRSWRGYCGRVAWEDEYEAMWRRELSAALLTRNVRGWLARLRVDRARHAIARTEFERSRTRFRAAQLIQSLTRGFLKRKSHRLERAKILKAVVCMQRIWRGYSLRARMWHQVANVRATMIAAAIRGTLVRRRQFRLICNVVCIQRNLRRWLRKSAQERIHAVGWMRLRQGNASKIQKHFRRHLENKRIEYILDQDRSRFEQDLLPYSDC